MFVPCYSTLLAFIPIIIRNDGISGGGKSRVEKVKQNEGQTIAQSRVHLTSFLNIYS